MIPLPELVTNKLTLPLQLISSQLATGFLQLIGIPVFRQGNIIDMGVRQMQIVDACSGLRYILALLALGVIFCYFYQRKPWKIIILLNYIDTGDHFCQCPAGCGNGGISRSAGGVLACFFRLADFHFLLWDSGGGELSLESFEPPRRREDI